MCLHFSVLSVIVNFMINPVIKMLIDSPGQGFLPSKLLETGSVSNMDIDEVLHIATLMDCEKKINYSGGNLIFSPNISPVSPLFIESAFQGELLGHNVISFPETQSTNDIAWGYSGKRENSGTVVLAESQRAGRGRYSDRQWLDTPGNSVLMSVLLCGDMVAPEFLSVAAGIAVAETIGDYCGLEATIKWPNDILFGAKKLSGVMVEARTVGGEIWYVLGLGVNCNQSQGHFPVELEDMATSIYMETGVKVDRDAFILFLLEKLDDLLSAGYSQDEIAQRWSILSTTESSRLVLKEQGVNYSGIVESVDPFKGLTLRLEGGSLRFFDARTASVVSF